MRVLFTTQPGEGHLDPLVPLARALLAAGHEVAVACAPSFGRLVEARGLRAVPMGLDWKIAPDDNWDQHWPRLRDIPPDQFITFVMAEIFAGDVTERALPDLLAIARAWSPDVIVRETCEFAGWLAADILGLPHASVEVTLFAFFQRDAAPIAASLAPLLARAGRPTDDVAARLFAQLHLSFVPPSFQDPEAPLPVTAHALRTLPLDPLPDEQIPPWLTTMSDRPLVYATGGTAGDRTDFFAAVIAAVRELDVALVATVGRTLDPAQFGPQPRHVHLARYISQSLLLPRCDVVVNHGGFSSVLGALARGVPLVILPQSADQPVNASRAKALGVAIVLEADQRTPTAIRTAVQTILDDPRYRQRARAVQAEIEALPGPEWGVILLERLVAERRPVGYAPYSAEAVA